MAHDVALSRAKRGGVREGAGRPTRLSREISEAKKALRSLGVSRRAVQALERGLDILVVQYPAIVEASIKEALGDPGSNIKPNPFMLKTLLEFIPRLISEESAVDKSPIFGLLGKLQQNVTNIQVNVQPGTVAEIVEADRSGYIDGVASEDGAGVGEGVPESSEDQTGNGG